MRSAYSAFFPLWILFLATPSAPPAAAAERPLPAATHYSLIYRIFPDEERLEGRVEVTVDNRTAEAIDAVPFLLYRLLDVQRVSDENGTPLEFVTDIVRDADDSNLQVNLVTVGLREALLPGASARITLKFAGSIHGYREVWGYVRDTISEEYTLLREDTFAYPLVSWATAESRYLDRRFTYDLEVSVPRGYVVAAGGRRTGERVEGEREVVAYVSKVPVWRLDVAVARFSTRTNDDGTLAVYVLPGHEKGADRVLTAMEQSAELYGRLFGARGDLLGLTAIEIPADWGSQAGDLYFLQTAAAFEDPDRISEVYHEVAHNWNPRPRPAVQRCRFFDEAFASYFEALALGALRSDEAYLADLEANRRSFARSVDNDARSASMPIVDYGREEMGHLSYTKGAWSLYVLHRLVGEEPFREIVRRLIERSSKEGIGFDEFEQVAEAVAGGPLDGYFDDWFRGTESSRLLVEAVPIEEILARYR